MKLSFSFLQEYYNHAVGYTFLFLFWLLALCRISREIRLTVFINSLLYDQLILTIRIYGEFHDVKTGLMNSSFVTISVHSLVI